MKLHLMTFSEDQLKSIEEMSAALMSPFEIALLLKLSKDERNRFEEVVKNHFNDPAYLAYHSGRLKTKLELRQTVIKLAKHGSPAAEPLADKYMREQDT